MDSQLKTPPFRRVRDGILATITELNLKPGDRLPAETALGKRFSVSRTTVRRALAALCTEGFLRNERNRGCIVHGKAPAGGQPDSTGELLARTVVVLSDIPDATEPGSASGILQGLTDEALRFGITVLCAPMASGTAAGNPLLYGRAHPAGLIVIGWKHRAPDSRTRIAELSKAGVPVAAYGMDDCPEAVNRYDRVRSDHESGVEELVRHLHGLGCCTIQRLWLSPEQAPWIAAHNRGFERAATALGLPMRPAFQMQDIPFRETGNAECFRSRVRAFTGNLAECFARQGRPDALMLETDSDLYPAAAACRLLGLTPGRDIRLTGYDNYWLHAFERTLEPCHATATVDKNNSRIGAELLRTLHARMTGTAPAAPVCISVPQSVLVCTP